MRAAAASTLIALLFVAAEPASARQISADQIMQDLRRGERVELPRRSVVTGELTLEPGNSLTATRVTFKGPVSTPLQPDYTKSGFLVFDESQFKDDVVIAGVKLDTLDCPRCTFEGDADFHSLDVRHMDLKRAFFKGTAGFIASDFGDAVLYDTRFDQGATFAGATFGFFDPARLQTTSPIVISWSQFGDAWAEGRRQQVFGTDDDEDRAVRAAQAREEFRFWRRNFDALDLDDDAREANYALVKLNRRQDWEWWKPNTYAPYLMSLPSGYGTAPYRPFWIAVGGVVLFVIAFALVGFMEPQKTGGPVMIGRGSGALFAIPFSVQAFVPFLKLPGMKEWEPRRFWWLEPVEGVIGALVFGVAAYSAALNL